MGFRMKLSTKKLVDLFFDWTDRYRLEALGSERAQFTEGMQQYPHDQMRPPIASCRRSNARTDG